MLSPEVITTISKDQLAQSVPALQSAGLKWPVELQLFLWVGHVNDLMMNARVTRQSDKLEAYWSKVRPYSQSPSPLNLLEPSLAALSMKQSEKIDAFVDHVVTTCLIETVLQGQALSQMLLFLCQGFLKQIQPLELDLASSLFGLQSGVKALIALLQDSWTGYEEARADLEALKSPDSATGVLALFSKGVGQTPACQAKHQNSLGELRTMQLHKKDLEELRAFLNSEQKMCETYVTTLSEKLRFIPALQLELCRAA